MQRILILGLILTAIIAPASADILTCKSPEGKTIYTDDARKCGKQQIAEVKVDIAQATRVNYRYPERQYETITSRWSIFIERPEKESDRALYNKAIKRLEKALELSFNKFPQKSHEKLHSVTFYIMRGPKSTLGGEDAVLRYFPHGSTQRYSLHDRRWNNAVVIYNIDNFLWQSDFVIDGTIIHELAHAWHFLQWSYRHQPIVDSWLNSRSSGLYLSVKNRAGRLLKPAYATTNEYEYFAELSAIYFFGGDYHPFNKEGLKKYDPTGYSMVEQHWLLTQ